MKTDTPADTRMMGIVHSALKRDLTRAAPAWTAAVLLLTGVAAAGWLLRTGDVIPAMLYLPTMLLGWTLV